MKTNTHVLFISGDKETVSLDPKCLAYCYAYYNTYYACYYAYAE